MQQADRLIWCDLETTGLDPFNNLLLEVGFKITDLDLNVIDETSIVIWKNTEYAIPCSKEKMDPYVWEMHSKNGLLSEASATGSGPEQSRVMVYNWLISLGVSRDDPLCGSSVQFDRKWLEEWMPDSVALFSYRNIDVSTIKELCKRYNPILFAGLESEAEPQKLHRVLPDIDDTIAEFAYYRDNFLFWQD